MLDKALFYYYAGCISRNRRNLGIMTDKFIDSLKPGMMFYNSSTLTYYKLVNKPDQLHYKENSFAALAISPVNTRNTSIHYETLLKCDLLNEEQFTKGVQQYEKET